MPTAYSDIWYDSSDARLKLYARDYGIKNTHTSRMPVLCMHGLTRNSADFGAIAGHLASRYRVISVDQRGRGNSAWDDQPANYNPGIYCQDMFKLMGDLGLTRTAIIGTSMGGIIGMIMGAMAPQAVIGMVINDVGPELDPVGLARIAGYTGKGAVVSGWDEAALRAREVNGIAFPDYDHQDWLDFARRTYAVDARGIIAPAYDPAIANAFKAPDPSPDTPPAQAVAPPDMWGLWDGLEGLPILAVRGAISDLLSAETLERMAERHPGMQAVTVPNRGHAPMLDEPVAVAAIDAFLETLETL